MWGPAISGRMLVGQQQVNPHRDHSLYPGTYLPLRPGIAEDPIGTCAGESRLRQGSRFTLSELSGHTVAISHADHYNQTQKKQARSGCNVWYK